MVQYDGLKHRDDDSDACWLAQLLRLGLLPEAYIYPKEDRPLRDLLRKRTQLVRQRSALLLSLQNSWYRDTGRRMSAPALMSLDRERVREQLKQANLIVSVESTLDVLLCLDQQVQRVEQEVLRQVKPDPVFRLLKTLPGVGNILGTTIRLETGPISRFASTGCYASYCRAVSSRQLSNGKVKGKGNTKNGNAYLSWAWLEAAIFAIRYHEPVRRWYQRKLSRTHRVVALKAVAHKLARAGYHVMRDGVPFEMRLAFG
jgi:transposase